MERETAAGAMKEKVALKYQCDVEDVEFPGGLNLGTTWAHGQDFNASYIVRFAGKEFEGQVYWSTIDQEARV